MNATQKLQQNIHCKADTIVEHSWPRRTKIMCVARGGTFHFERGRNISEIFRPVGRNISGDQLSRYRPPTVGGQRGGRHHSVVGSVLEFSHPCLVSVLFTGPALTSNGFFKNFFP